MYTMTLSEFNEIPSFFHKGKECIEIDGKIYNKSGVLKFLIASGIIVS
jgi:hypothetical protein